MALMERVATLLRANLNDLIDRAEDPERMMKQLVIDIENQLLQLKTQVAIALADQHLLEKKCKEHGEASADWRKKAELAVNKGDDGLARAALERALSSQSLADGFSEQVVEQSAEADAMRGTYNKLQAKLKETQARCELLVAQHRRAKMVGRATAAISAAESKTPQNAGVLGRFKTRIQSSEAENAASKAMQEESSIEDRFARVERDEKVDKLLGELKLKQSRMLEAG